MAHVRQLDMHRHHPDFYTIPKYLPGRLEADDFIFFKFPNSLNPQRYTVVIEGLDMSDNNPNRSIGKLNSALEVPQVKLGWHARLGVIPDSEQLPSFESELYRGSTYIIPDTGRMNGVFRMEQHGIVRPN